MFAQRTNMILLLSIFVLLPLCSLKSLNSLSPFSLLGLGGTLYTAIFMTIRYLDKSYAPGGSFYSLIPSKPSFYQRGGYSLNHLTFVLLSMLSTAYIAHYNAPAFYNELEHPTMEKFNKVVGSAFGTSILFFIFVMSIGFLTFGGNTAGFILNNYSGQDKLATVARFAIGLALLTGYPFTFSALRNGILEIMRKQTAIEKQKLFTPLTLSLLTVVTAMALVLRDVGFVVSISGAMFGCLLMFIIPGVMNLASFKKDADNKSAGRQMEKLGNYGIMGTGLIMAILGVYVTIARQLGKM
jgi:amino acid permease